jgi:KUP system potassium uptake protein
MNIDKDEERGGILALSFLCSTIKHSNYKTISIVLGMLGAALLFGDGVITPAISVLVH